MAGVAAISDAEVAGWVALARLVLGPAMNVQAPPNLAPNLLERLLRAGVNDWGGVSPLTIDFINPEAPWPALRELRRRTEAAGQRLVERLPVYPQHLLGRPDFFEPRVREAALARVDESGWVRVEAEA
jgi:FO synthase